MRKWAWILLLVLVVLPLGILSIGTQVAVAFGLLGGAQTARALDRGSAPGLTRGTALLAVAGQGLESTWSNPTSWLVQYNPLTLGTVDDLRALALVVGQATSALPPAAALGEAAVGFGGTTPLVQGSTVSLEQLPGLVEPSTSLYRSLAGLESALAGVPDTGLIGSRVGPRAQDLSTPRLGSCRRSPGRSPQPCADFRRRWAPTGRGTT